MRRRIRLGLAFARCGPCAPIGPLAVVGAHLYLVLGVLLQTGNKRFQRSDRGVFHRQPLALRRLDAVAVVVVGDRRSRICRGQPTHPHAGNRHGIHFRRSGRQRRLLRIGHRHHDCLLRGQGAIARTAGHGHHHDVLVVGGVVRRSGARHVLRILEVGSDLEQQPATVVDREHVAVRAAGNRKSDNRVPVVVGGLQRNPELDVLCHARSRGAGEPRGGVVPERRCGGLGCLAVAGVAHRPQLERVQNVIGEPGHGDCGGCRSTR